MTANLFLLGAPRSGTTQTANWLNMASDISLAPVKEPSFFDRADNPPEWTEVFDHSDVAIGPLTDRAMPGQFHKAHVRTLQDYQRLFAQVDAPYRMDASTGYLASPSAVAEIRSECPDAQCVVLLREPVRRTISSFYLARRIGRIPEGISLRQAIEDELAGNVPIGGQVLMRPSRYAEHVRRIDAHIGLENCYVLSFEEVLADAEGAVAGICDWLGVSSPVSSLQESHRNASVKVRSEVLDGILRRTGLFNVMRRHVPHGMKRRLSGLYHSSTELSGGADRETLEWLEEELWPHRQFAIAEFGFSGWSALDDREVQRSVI